jgi:L-ascorbate peroxidase
LIGAKEMIDGIIYEKNCGPISWYTALAWHDSVLRCQHQGRMAQGGGAIASTSDSEPEMESWANAGLINATSSCPAKTKFLKWGYADIYQMASARSIEQAGGPTTGVMDVLMPKVLNNARPRETFLTRKPDDGMYGGEGGTAS